MVSGSGLFDKCSNEFDWIGLIVDGLDESAVILKWGLHYQVVGYDVWLGEMLLAMGILILFGILNILGVKKAGIVQTILAKIARHFCCDIDDTWP